MQPQNTFSSDSLGLLDSLWLSLEDSEALAEALALALADALALALALADADALALADGLALGLALGVGDSGMIDSLDDSEVLALQEKDRDSLLLPE
jgi:hypothetical protein